MKLLLVALLAFAIPSASMAAGGFKKEKFQKIFYLEKGGKGSESGLSADNAADFADADVYAIPADAVIEKVYFIVDTAITAAAGTIDLGDDDDSNDYCPSANITAGTVGMYCNNSNTAGAYLASSSNPLAKWYSAAGKEVKLDVGGTFSTGKARVVVEGFLL